MHLQRLIQLPSELKHGAQKLGRMSESLVPAEFKLHQHHGMGKTTQRLEQREAKTKRAVKDSHGTSIGPF